MSCTTILVGRKASHDGSTMIARNDDGFFDVKKLIVVEPKQQPRKYKSVISHLEIELPDNPLRYTACPSIDQSNGIWAACGINAANVAMTATETITSNPRVLGADPYVVYRKAEKRGQKDVPGGLGSCNAFSLSQNHISRATKGEKNMDRGTKPLATRLCHCIISLNSYNQPGCPVSLKEKDSEVKQITQVH